MSFLTTTAAFVITATPLVFGAIRAYTAWAKHKADPVDGWGFSNNSSSIATNGILEATVSIRTMGPVDHFEVHAFVWDAVGTVDYETDDYIPKHTCDSDEIRVTVKYPVPSGETGMANAPKVGVIWTNVSKRRVIEQAARLNVHTGDYQRYRWRTMRNLIMFRSHPSGLWKSIQSKSPSESYSVPRLASS